MGKRDATKRLLISKAPPILTVHLKMSAQTLWGRLNPEVNGRVTLPEVLDVQPLLAYRYFDYIPSCWLLNG